MHYVKEIILNESVTVSLQRQFNISTGCTARQSIGEPVGFVNDSKESIGVGTISRTNCPRKHVLQTEMS